MRERPGFRSSDPCAVAMRYFCVCFIVNLSLVAGESVQYVLQGREAILSPDLFKHPDNIMWKHNGDTVITFDSKEERVYGQYEGRVTLAWDTAELTISDVRYVDSGEYELDALIKDRLYRSQFMLKVLDKVAKPTITCAINDESSNKTSGERATLLCSSDSRTPESLSFKWNLDGKVHLDQRITIPLGNEHDELEYSCTVTNPLHAETTVFITKDCYTERNSENLTVVLPIIIIFFLVLIALFILVFIFRNKLKKVCFKKGEKGENDDLEKQKQKAADESEAEEYSPLLHRQQTLPSKQKLTHLPQSDNGNVADTPQKQENNKDLEELNRSVNVQKNRSLFDKCGPTKELLNKQTEAENNTDNSEKTTPQHALSSTVPNSGADDPESKGQTDSEVEAYTERSDLDNAQEIDAAKEESKEESSEASGQPELLPQPSVESGPPHVDQDSESGPSELESKDQSDSDEKSHTDPAVDNEPQRHHSDHEKDEESDPTGDSETSTTENSDLEETEKSILADDSEPTHLESSEASGQTELLPETTLQSVVPVIDQDPESGPGELESKSQRDVDGKSHTDPTVEEEPQRHHCEREKEEESDLTGDSEQTTREEMTHVQSSPDPLPDVPNNTCNNEETACQPEALDKVPEENPDPKIGPDKLESKVQTVEQETKEEEGPLRNDSISNCERAQLSNPDGDLDSSTEEESDLQTSTASEQPGSEKKKNEQEESESLPPTPPPASPLSQSVDFTETEDTDGEHKADANSDQVSVETKTDKDSPGSEQINDPDKSSEEKTAVGS